MPGSQLPLSNPNQTAMSPPAPRPRHHESRARRHRALRRHLPRSAHHEARITVDFPAAGDTLEVWMSRSSPGRYALHEFAKNVYDVQRHRPGWALRSDRAKRSLSLAGGGGAPAGALHLHPVRRPGRRHLRPDRPHSRAPQHACHLRLGTGAGDAAGGGPLHPTDRRRLAGRDPARPRRRLARVGGARSGLLHGQPHRAERLRLAYVDGVRRQAAEPTP